jgi:hypothetical protein
VGTGFFAGAVTEAPAQLPVISTQVCALQPLALLSVTNLTFQLLMPLLNAAPGLVRADVYIHH